jgi:hypothetical protein
MPESYRYLRVRLQIEQQRFLNFGLEAGILYTDGELSAKLRVNRSLLLIVLAEIKALLENYAKLNGKYEKLMPQLEIDRKDHTELETDLTNLLHAQPEEEGQRATEQPSKKAGHLEHIRNFGRRVAQSGRTLRTIIVEPKRLVWAAIDQESFKSLVSKLENFNSFLIALLDSSQIRRLQDTMAMTYLEILEIRNDIASLSGLVKALTPSTKSYRDSGVDFIGSQTDLSSDTLLAETEYQNKKIEYLKQLVSIKIQYTKMDKFTGEEPLSLPFNKPNHGLLDLKNFTFPEAYPDWHNMPYRTSGAYKDIGVWIEWNKVANDNSYGKIEQVERRIGLLTDLLSYDKPDEFKAPPCLGYVRVEDIDYGTRFGIVFKNPSSEGAAGPDPPTLRYLVQNIPKPSLSDRIALCAILARCIQSFHSVNWLHKGLRSQNIIIFQSSERWNFSSPYVSGFELSRPSIMDQLTEKPAFNPWEEAYRHPDAQSSQTDGNYCKSYDIYSLGIVFIEIALWRSIEDIAGFAKLAKIKPSMLQDIKSWLLGRHISNPTSLVLMHSDKGSCLEQLVPECGDVFRNVVECCLTADNAESPEYYGESKLSIALRLQRIMGEDIVKKLDNMSDVL